VKSLDLDLVTTDPASGASAPLVGATPAGRAARTASSLSVGTGAAVAGMGLCVPVRRVGNDVLTGIIDTSDAWIVERTGIRERRWAGPDESTLTLAVGAAQAALVDAGMAATEIDFIMVATCTPEQTLPATAPLVAEALGVQCAAMDLVAACAGFVYGLVTASSLLATGGFRAGLLIGADVLSRVTDFEDRTTAVLFADGAGAAVLIPNLGPGIPAISNGADGALGLLAWDLGADGSAARLLEIPSGGSRRPPSAETVAGREHYIRMEGKEVFRRAVRIVVQSATTTLERAGVEAADVALFVPHQANARIIDAVLPRLGIPPERTVVNIDRFGNTSAASIPIALSEAAADGRVKPGDLVLMTGFGAGMTWGTALLRWGCP
jgi:3-oxoacyl-[acyl-carrier-protein] synthase-3